MRRTELSWEKLQNKEIRPSEERTAPYHNENSDYYTGMKEKGNKTPRIR